MMTAAFAARWIVKFCLAALFSAMSTLAFAQDRPNRLEVWDLKLGTPVDQMPDEFTDYACGTNGGPPSVPLTG
jgi:hypothetical protein